MAAWLHRLLTSPITVGSATIPLQVRVAACQYPAHGATIRALLDHLQSAIRFSKESGRNIVLYSDTLDELLRTEALVRLPDGQGGYYSAGQVISLAERNGLVEELGDYVLCAACAFMRTRGHALGLGRISVNLSVQQLLVGEQRGASAAPDPHVRRGPHRITLEITESILIQAVDHTPQTLKRLRPAGIHIALDDFGVGDSSLNHLSNLTVDIIKIDRSLTKRILTNEKQRALLQSIVEMAVINGLAVVAEGVETEAEQALIAAAGVHYTQGYHYARPMPEERAVSFLQEKRT